MNIIGWIICLLVALIYPVMYYGYRTLLNQKLRQVRVVFESEDVKETLKDLKSEIRYEDFVSRYTGLKIFAIPLALCFTITFIVAVFFFNYHNIIQLKAFPIIQSNVIFAGFIGTYLWSLYDLLRRYNQIDFTSSTFYHVFISLLLGLIVGYIFSYIFPYEGAFFLAFCIGAFPIGIVRNYFVGEGVNRLNIKLSVENINAEPESLCYLQGATKDVIARLTEEGITSAQCLAYSNPLKVFFRTNLDLAVILDLIDQAILYIYIENRIVTARTIGVRAATDIGEIYDLLNSKNIENKKRGQFLIQELANKIGEANECVREIVEKIGIDVQVHLIGDLLYEAQLN